MPKHGPRCRTANGGRAAGQRAAARDYNRTTPAHGQSMGSAAARSCCAAAAAHAARRAGRAAAKRETVAITGRIGAITGAITALRPVIAVIARVIASYYSYYSESGSADESKQFYCVKNAVTCDSASWIKQ